jgi:hypothetical protein
MHIKRNIQFLSLLIVVLASIRGLFVYHFGINPSLIYTLSATSIVLLGLVTIRYIFNLTNTDRLLTLRKALLYNYIIISIYTIFYLVFVGLSEISTIYFFILFPIIFLLIKFETKYLELAVHIVSIITII